MGAEDATGPVLGWLLRQAHRALVNRIARDLAAVGFSDLRPAHFTVFQHLEADGSRLTDLAARAQITKQSMGALVDDLERWRYVERIADPSDGRVRLVRLTRRGWTAEATASATIAAFEREWAERVGAERMRAFQSVLEEMAATTDSAGGRNAAGPSSEPRNATSQL
jgi:DNA-binding MarR family transcriptional regulator